MKTTCGNMDIIDERNTVIQPLHDAWYQGRVRTVAMLRLDLLHPVISGNKWFKLKHNLAFAQQQGFKTIVTFGGAYSNHLVATAAAARHFGLAAVGIVRGMHSRDRLTPTLEQCQYYGMTLRFETIQNYRRKEDSAYVQQLHASYQQAFIIAEGGANDLGREGAGAIASFVPDSYTHICVSLGSGTTFIGLGNALPPSQALIGFAPMKGGSYLQDETAKYINVLPGAVRTIFDRWHFGGFGKCDQQLIDFMNRFYVANDIPLDLVYTAKMMYGVQDLIAAGYFPPFANILCIHTGGLQGNTSISGLLSYGT